MYSSTLISVLPPDTSAKILIFANKNLKMDFDLDIYRCAEQSIFDCEENPNDNVIKNNDKVVKNNGKATKTMMGKKKRIKIWKKIMVHLKTIYPHQRKIIHLNLEMFSLIWQEKFLRIIII